MVNAIALVLAVAAASSPKDATPVVKAVGPDQERPAAGLFTTEDVSRLCAALRPVERLRPPGDAVEKGEAQTAHDSARDAALSQRYEISTPAAGLQFAPYDGQGRRLALAEPVQVPIAGGIARLWPAEESSLAVEIDAPTARKLLSAQRAGTLSLSLTFDLPDDATCGADPQGKRFTIPIEPVAWRWVDGTSALAAGGAAADRPLPGSPRGVRLKVDVGDPIAGPAEAKKTVFSRLSELEACYAEALARSPGIDGVVVADVTGKSPAIAADSVGDPDLAACVLRALAPLALSKGAKGAVPIRFELEQP